MGDIWTMKEALGLIQALQPETRRFGYHLCLGGGVLNKGESQKDLDLYFLTLDNGKDSQPEKLKDWLVSVWGEAADIGKSYIEEYKQQRLTAEMASDSSFITYYYDSLQRTMLPRKKPAMIQQFKSDYAFKLKFNYSGMRIDVFII